MTLLLNGVMVMTKLLRKILNIFNFKKYKCWDCGKLLLHTKYVPKFISVECDECANKERHIWEWRKKEKDEELNT